MLSCHSTNSVFLSSRSSRHSSSISCCNTVPRLSTASASKSPSASARLATSALAADRAVATRSRNCTHHTTPSITSVVFLPVLFCPFSLCVCPISKDALRVSHHVLTSERNLSRPSATAARSLSNARATAGRRNSSVYFMTSRNTWCGCGDASAPGSSWFKSAMASDGNRRAPKCSRSFSEIRVSTGNMRAS